MDGHATNGDKNESNLVQKKQEASEVEAYKNQSDDAEFRSVMPVSDDVHLRRYRAGVHRRFRTAMIFVLRASVSLGNMS